MQNSSEQRIQAPIPETDSGLESRKRRSPVSQQDFPSSSLKEALRIPKALFDRYGGASATAVEIAAAMDLSPTGGYFRGLCGAAAAYGLTEGGTNAQTIMPTSLARRIIRPSHEGDDLAAKREAFLRPKFINDFLTRYNGQRLPNESMACNNLASLGVPHDKVKDGYDLICNELKELGLSRNTGGYAYVTLPASISPAGMQARELAATVEATIAPPPPKPAPPPVAVTPAPPKAAPPPVTAAPAPPRPVPSPPVTAAPLPPVAPAAPPVVTWAPPSPAVPVADRQGKVARIYVSRGRNLEIAKQIHELLTNGQYKPVVSIEEVSLTAPISQKVLEQMRHCDAAVIHVGMDRTESGTGGQQLNENVLIEIGAAMALYDGRMVILVEEGVKLPSNVQGIFEVRYRGGELTYSAAMNLLKKFHEF